MRYSLILAALLVAACSSQPPAPEQSPSGVEDGKSRAPQSDTKTVPPPAAPEAFDPYSVAGLKDARSPLSKRSVYFDYDSYVIKGEFSSLIAAHAKFLANNPSFKVLLQGNADERGSREYNLALGQKRADAVKKALTLLGVREDQVESVSLGKEKPVCTESNEECWSKNRRADVLHSAAREF